MTDQTVRDELTAQFPAIQWSWNAAPPPVDLLAGLKSAVSFRDLSGKTWWDRFGGSHFAFGTPPIATRRMWPWLHHRTPQWTIAGVGGSLRVGTYVVKQQAGAWMIRSTDTTLPNFALTDYVYAENVRDLTVWDRALTEAEKAAYTAQPVYPFDGSPLSSVGNGKALKVIALWGQSNVEGVAPISQLPNQLLPWTPECPMYPSQAGVPSWRASAAPAYGNLTTFGPELSLGAGLGDGYAICKFGVGGTNLYEQWKAGTGSLYQASKLALFASLNELISAGFAPTVHCILWMQGLTDAKVLAHAQAYQQNLTDVFAQWRTDWGANLPIVYSREPQGVIGLPAYPYAQQIRDANEAVAGGSNLMQDFDSYTFLPDGIHYDTPSMVQIGYDMADVIKAL